MIRLRIRHRIAILVALAALGLVATAAVTLVLGRRAERQVSGIETQYVPLLELDHDAESLFAAHARALEDAAAAADENRLVDADQRFTELARRLAAASETISRNHRDAFALVVELAAYHTVARAVAAQLVEGMAPADLAGPIENMTSRRRAFAEHLDAATRPDRARLADAFAVARRSQRQALVIESVLATIVLALMALLSWHMIRTMARSLRAVSAGVERLARGEFGEEIVVATHDELGELAQEANRTAARLRTYRTELEARNAELARASKYKSEFLAKMSHELRTPLNSILILSKVLGENDAKTLTPKQIEYAETIHRAGNELLGLIGEVLDLAKIEAGKQSVELGPVNLTDLEDYIHRMFDPLAAEKGVTFVVEVAADAPATVRTDRTRLRQIVNNLLANAFKFTERGAVTVRVAAADPTRYPAIPDPFEISVTDTGIGIASEKLAQIFEAFAQEDNGTSRTFGGTGLGLTIGKQLAGLLGGDLFVESTRGTGSTFTLVLPVSGPAEANAPEQLASTPHAGPSPSGPLLEPALVGKTVLVVDDDVRNVFALAASLRERRIGVVSANSGQTALARLAASGHIDAVLLDVMMPGMDGHETTRQIRAIERFRTLPVIAVTASTSPSEREKSLAAGATAYVTKPIDIDRLVGVLRSAIEASDHRDTGHAVRGAT